MCSFRSHSALPGPALHRVPQKRRCRAKPRNRYVMNGEKMAGVRGDGRRDAYRDDTAWKRFERGPTKMVATSRAHVQTAPATEVRRRIADQAELVESEQHNRR